MAAKKSVTSDEPVKPLKVPAALKGVENGKLPDELLHRVKCGGHMWTEAAKKFNEMWTKAQADGIELKNIGDYRPYAAQKQLFLDRYQRTESGRVPQITREWNGSTWYLKKGKSPSGVPGTSNHGWGLAIDIDVTNPKVYKWLVDNGPNYGFYLQGPKERDGKPNPEFEAWHWQYCAG